MAESPAGLGAEAAQGDGQEHRLLHGGDHLGVGIGLAAHKKRCNRLRRRQRHKVAGGDVAAGTAGAASTSG